MSGRKADTIVSGGENVAPTEVEAVLEAHPDVLEAAVIGRPRRAGARPSRAIVVARPGATLERRGPARPLRRGLAAIRSPSSSFSHEPLPRTRSGKLLRKELPGGAEERSDEL